ncbi:MAG: 2Fe-2S iron-sulfur cluster-binding protein [Anaerolineales bacterium]|jgi:NADH dehydrogenase/NADH:ubiquinone oxidoreductase subunit G
MDKSVRLSIDGQPLIVPEGTTILQAARQVGTCLPTICYHEYCTSNALCRQCVVEVEKSRVLVASCVGKVAEGMQVHTRTPRVKRARKTILEMMAASLDLSQSPELKEQMSEFGAEADRFPGAERRSPPVLDDNPMYVRDYSKCILCWRCVQVCAEDAQYTFAINFTGRGFHTQIGTFFDRPIPETTCVFCGQCVGVCPTGALKGKREWLLEQGMAIDRVLEVVRRSRRKKRPVGVHEGE